MKQFVATFHTHLSAMLTCRALTGAGPTLNGQIAVCIGFAALLVISLMNIVKEK